MKIRPVSTILLCLLAACVARAQHVGVSGSYRIGLLESGRLSDDWRAWCGCDATGSALAQQTLFTAAFAYGEENSPFTAGAGLGFATGLTRFVSPTYRALRPDLPAEATLQYRESLRSTAIRVDLEGRYRTDGEASVMLGPWFEYLLGSSIERSERIITPEGTDFPGEGNERDLVGAPEVPQASLRWGMTLGVAVSMPVSPTVNLVPHALLETDLQGLGRSRPGALSFGFGTSVVFEINREPRPAGVAPITERSGSLEAMRPPTSAMVTLFAIDGDRHLATARVRRETTYRRFVAQMPRRVAPPDKTQPSSQGTPAPPHGTAGSIDPPQFTTTMLIESPHSAVDEHALDILGMRMREHPSSHLRLLGAWLPHERPEAGRARAERVRDHLAARWSIDRDRVGVAAEAVARRADTDDADTAIEPRVRVADASSALTAPVVLEWLDERLTLPPLGVDPVVDAPRGIVSTRLRIVRAGRILSEGSIVGASTMSVLEVDLRDALDGDSPAPIVAELEVLDSSGATTRAVDELPLAVAADAGSAGFDREVVTFSFVDCNDPACHDREILGELERALVAGARVRVQSTRRQALPGSMLAAAREMIRRSGVVVEESEAVGGARVVVEVESARR